MIHPTARFAPLIALLLILPGCLSATDEGAPDEMSSAIAPPEAAASREAAPEGAVALGGASGSGKPAPSAYFYRVPRPADEPLKESIHKEYTGQFEAQDCTIPGGQAVGGSQFRPYDLREFLSAGDVFWIRATLTFENADDAWGDIHLFMNLPGGFHSHRETVADTRGPVEQVLETQHAYPGRENDPAMVAVVCFYGLMSKPVEYTLTLHIEFAQDVVPASLPVLFHVPEGATQLLVAGVPFVEGEEVSSHYRVFRPDDSLLGELALGKSEGFDEVALDGPGAYVILVDHTENGFVRIGTDAKPTSSDLVLLSSKFERVVDFVIDGENSVDKKADFEIATVPLGVWTWVEPPTAGPGQGSNVHLQITNARGTVVDIKMANFVSASLAGFGSEFIGLPGTTEWGFQQDHHAYAPGPHTITVKADTLRGVVAHYVRVYDRAGSGAA